MSLTIHELKTDFKQGEKYSAQILYMPDLHKRDLQHN